MIRCSLCSYDYIDDEHESNWSDLPDDWVCPICGSPKSLFSPVVSEAGKVPEKPVAGLSGIRKYECVLCANIYNETTEGVLWVELEESWKCPVCGAGKDLYNPVESNDSAVDQPIDSSGDLELSDYLQEWKRHQDDVETQMVDIHHMSEKGSSVYEPMRSRLPLFSWDEILVKGAQLFRLPLNKSQPVDTRTTIGPKAGIPLVIETPLIVSHMSFGALSKEAKLALARGSAGAGGAMSSGEGGILPESLEASHKYIFEYVPNKYSVTDEYLTKVDAVEIKIGQSAKPGMGGHLPGDKVTREISEIRGFREGQDIISPSRFPEIRTQEDLKETVDMLRDRSKGKPIGLKLAAGHIEKDIEIALYAGVDFITIDGRAGGTGAALKSVKNAASVPTIFALHRARKTLDDRGAVHVSLIITGGLRIASDIAKALALGADAVALATASMMAVGCQQYRICNTGKCPVGIATQDATLRARLDVDASAKRVENFFRITTEEIQEFARLSGHSSIHDLSVEDLCTVNSEISLHTDIEHA